MKTRRERSFGGTLLVAGVVLLILAGLMCGATPGSLVPLPRELEELRGHLVLLGVAVGVAVAVGLSLLPSWATRGRDDDFYEDAVAGPMGWTVRPLGLFARRWTGDWRGRRAQLVANMGRHSPFANPGQLRLYLSAQTGRRVHLTRPEHGAVVADLSLGLSVLRLPDAAGLVGLAHDAAGARAWLTWGDSGAAAQRLLSGFGDSMALLRVEPDAISLTLSGPAAHTWTPDDLRWWLTDLATLAEGLETVGPPSPPDAPWPAEHALQHHPERRLRRGAWTCTGCLAVLVALYLLSALLIVLAASLG